MCYYLPAWRKLADDWTLLGSDYFNLVQPHRGVPATRAKPFSVGHGPTDPCSTTSLMRWPWLSAKPTTINLQVQAAIQIFTVCAPTTTPAALGGFLGGWPISELNETLLR